jgi:hypothetical protein
MSDPPITTTSMHSYGKEAELFLYTIRTMYLFLVPIISILSNEFLIQVSVIFQFEYIALSKQASSSIQFRSIMKSFYIKGHLSWKRTKLFIWQI